MEKYLPLRLQYFADGEDSNDTTESNEGTQGGDNTPSEAKNTDTQPPKEDGKTIPYDRFKQVNDDLKTFKETFKELGIEGVDSLKTLVGDYKTKQQQEAERKKSEMTEIERLQAEKEEAENRVKEYEEKSNQALTKANERLMKSEFRLLAKELGVRNEALDDAFVLADLSSAEVDDDGNVKGVKEALEALKENKSYLFSSKNYADPSPANTEPKRDSSKDLMKKKLEELELKARKSGRIEDKVAYASYKREIGL